MSQIQLAFGLALIAGSIAAVHAQPAAPTRAASSAASDAYRSAFEGYRPFADQALAPWKQTNDTVRDVGGWRAYAREAQSAASASAPAPAPAPAASSASSPHAGHH